MVLKQHFQMKKWKERTCIRASLRLWVWVCIGVRERERERSMCWKCERVKSHSPSPLLSQIQILWFEKCGSGGGLLRKKSKQKNQLLF